MSNCSNNILSDDLLFNFDLSKALSYDGNTGFTINSLIKWDKAISENKVLLDYGLTAYDVGKTKSLTSSTEITVFNTKFKLYPIEYNDASGNTFNTLSGIDTDYESGVGQYFSLSGNYLQNFFKLEGFNYELLPYRYNKGFTIETWIKLTDDTFNNINNDNDGIFLYLGTRAENKFNILYSGDTDYLTQLSGSTLGSDDINNLENGLNNNVLAFKINNDSSLSIKMIDSNGYLLTKNSNKTITNISSGWTMFTITFTPYNIIDENIFEQVKDCYPIRLGDLKIYINGRPYWTLENFEEFYFKPLNTTSEKQIGVPYNISWGGGSFGLKHSYNFTSGSTTYPYEQNPYNQNLLIEQNFNGSFYGGIQKLRMYSKSLNFVDVLNNFRSDNTTYNKIDIKGGRIIYY